MIVVAARACVGTRTRAQGRIPGLALDCAGVVLFAARAAGLRPSAAVDYSIRSDNRAQIRRTLLRAGCREIAKSDAAPGDIVEVAVSRELRHLAVLCGETAVHAHFGVGRVVEAPLPRDWPIAACWRLPEIH